MPNREPTALQIRAQEIAEQYLNLPMAEKIGIIAQTFGCVSGQVKTSPCYGKWRGTSDIFLQLDNGFTLEGTNELTPKAKTKRVQNAYVDALLRRYNPEIVAETKKVALADLLKREARDNAIAAKKGLKPYTLLTVELHDGRGTDSGYIGWYYVTLAVDGVIHAHMETGLKYAIADGQINGVRSQRPYFTAGALEESDVDFVFNNVGFSSTSDLYSLELSDAVLVRARKALEERSKPQVQPHTSTKGQTRRASTHKHRHPAPGR